MTEMLRGAQARGDAIASVNVYSLESIHATLKAAQARQTPIILAFGARYLSVLSLEEAVSVTRAFGKDVDIPYALHFDHCSDLEQIRQAIDAGFSSVMYDGSALPYEENERNTAEAARLAHEANASAEAELGAIRTGENAAEASGDQQVYTQPAMATRFVNATGVDALAVSIGTVHGMYKGAPNIRLDVLSEIRKAVSVPLVLHGGSGTGKETLRQTIAGGVCKVNINTELSMMCVEAIRQAILRDPGVHLSQLSRIQTDCFQKGVERYIDMLTVNG